MRVTPTRADLIEAAKSFLIDYRELEERAVRVAAERMLKEGRKRQDELIAKLGSVHGQEWLNVHKELDAIWARHDKLLKIAYPRPPSPGTEGNHD